MSLPGGDTYGASRAVDAHGMEEIRHGSPQSMAPMMLQMLGQRAIDELRDWLDGTRRR